MSRSVFLSLKDEVFWNNGSDEEKTEEEEEPPAVEKDLKEEEGEEGECDGDGWQTATTATPQQQHLPSQKSPQKPPTAVREIKNPFQAPNNGPCSEFGGFARTNADTYFKSEATRKPKPSPNKKNAALNGNLHGNKKQASSSPRISRISCSGDAPPGLNKNNGSSPGRKRMEKALAKRISMGYEVIQRLGLDRVPTTAECDSPCSALDSKWYEQTSTGPEIYSRKVFVGGLPSDMTLRGAGQLEKIFGRFGKVLVDLPRSKGGEMTAYRGYAFLVYEAESSVGRLVDSCLLEEEKTLLPIFHNGKTVTVQVRAWRMADTDYLVHVSTLVNPKKTIFVGGVPRAIRAVELAHLMEKHFGPVLVAGVDVDVEFKYPKGAGRVVFERWESYRKAVSERWAVLRHGDVQRRVELKAYVLDDMVCEECRRPGQPAPFFCPHEDCLQYFCEDCWSLMHNRPGWGHHLAPLVKD